MNDYEQIVVKYKYVIELVKELFVCLYVGCDFDSYTLEEDYYIKEYGSNVCFAISEDLYNVLDKLERVVEYE